MSLTRSVGRTGLLLGVALSLAACSDDVRGPNRPPVALAGADQVVRPGVEVTLDGSGSYDPDGDALSGFAWSLLSAPAGSQASLDPAQARQPQVRFTPDLAGAYLFSLVVSDGALASARDVLQVRAVAAPCVTPADCPDDGLWCTGTPDCVDGFCVEIPPDCSDADACTQDLCDEENDRCDHPPVADPPPEDLATVGSCTDGVDNDCDGQTDGDDPGCGVCQDAGDCVDDGLWCTGTVDCVGGACVETPPDCADGDACTQDLCDEENDRCDHPPVADPPPEDLATPGSCADGVDNDCDGLTDGDDFGCASCEEAGDCPDDLDVCTGVECVAGACQYPPANEGGPCDDGLFCTEGDACAAGACGGQARDCSGAADACNTGVCDEGAGACVPAPLPNGTSCGVGSCQGLQWTGPTCEAGACTGSDTLDCNDGVFCTDDSCDGVAGCGHAPAHEGEECGPRACEDYRWNRVVCQAGACDLTELVQNCFDGNPCTGDECEALTGCQNPPNQDFCDDGDVCTTGDVCQDGVCVGDLIDADGDGYGSLAAGCGPDCDDSDEFVNPGAFEGSFGEFACMDGLDNDCDGLTDGEDATCLQCQSDNECDNGVFCDGAETCGADGACRSGSNPCMPESECNHCNEDAESCFDPLATACGSPADTACDNPDSCDGAGTCRPNLEPPGVACGDPSDTACTDPDSCDGAGACLPRHAAPGAACGSANDTDCDDPDSCDGAGLCLPNFAAADTPCGSPADTACTDPDTCSGAGVCLTNHAPENTPCPDALYCNGAERCSANGVCQAAANPCLPESECRHCDEDTASCFDPPGTACGDPSDTACTDPDTCSGAGVCLTNHAPEFTPCPDALYCNGAELCGANGVCQAAANPCLPESECNHCNEDADGCFDPPGTACGNPADTICTDPDSCDDAGVCLTNHAPEFTPCPDALFCNGAESCDASGQCVDRADPCPETDCNHCQEDTDSCFDPENTACGSPDDTVCSKPDGCDGAGTCSPNHAPEGVACAGTMTEEVCDSSCRAGVCEDGVPAADMAVCVTGGGTGALGVCCSSVCRAGGECCADADCDDGNGCTADACAAYLCASICPNPSCMQLDVESPATLGDPTPVIIDMCPGARDVDDFVCISSRNLEHLFLHQDFESNLDGFITNGNVDRYDTGSGYAARLCQSGATLQLRLDTRGLTDIAVSFVATDFGTEDNEIMELVYSPDGNSGWKSVVLVGDAALSPLRGLQSFHVILPADAEGNQELYLEWYLRNSNNGDDCVLVDNVTVYAMLPMTSVATPLPLQDFEGGDLGLFHEFDPHPEDVFLTAHGGSTRVRVDDNMGANLYSSPIDTSAVSPYDLLVLSWDWIGVNIGASDRYIVVQYSTDGVSWYQLSATGHVDQPTAYARYRAVLPCEAYGTASLRVRFLASGSSDNGENDGVNIDNVQLDVMQVDFLDSFGAFTDMAGGIYAGSMTSDPAGAFSVICRYGCTQWSNWDPVTVSP